MSVWRTCRGLMENVYLRLALLSAALMLMMPVPGITRLFLLTFTATSSVLLGAFICLHIVRILVNNFSWIVIRRDKSVRLFPNLEAPAHSFIESFKPVWIAVSHDNDRSWCNVTLKNEQLLGMMLQ